MHDKIKEILKQSQSGDIEWYYGTYNDYFATKNGAKVVIKQLLIGNHPDVFYLHVNKGSFNYGWHFKTEDKEYKVVKELYALARLKAQPSNISYVCKILDGFIKQAKKNEKKKKD